MIRLWNNTFKQKAFMHAREYVLTVMYTHTYEHTFVQTRAYALVVMSTTLKMDGYIPFYNILGLLPDTENCDLCMRRECRERFPRHRLQRKPLITNPGMHHGTCVTHVPWCMSRSLTRGGGENVPGIPGTCATRNFTYLARGPCRSNADLMLIRWLHSHEISAIYETETLHIS